MKTIPITENALIVRTDFSNQAAWDKLVAAAKNADNPDLFNMEFLQDHGFANCSTADLLKSLPDDYPKSFITIADPTALSQPDYPLLVVDLLEEPGREFRCIAPAIYEVDNNLSISNMDFAEFAECVDENGIYRGMEM